MQFNELVGNIVQFYVHGTIYKIRVKKETNKTCFHGEGLAQIITKFGLSGGEIHYFSMKGPQPRINIAYSDYEDAESVEQSSESEEDIGEEDNPL